MNNPAVDCCGANAPDTDSISVVIPALNAADALLPLIEALAAQDLPPLEVLVVDASYRTSRFIADVRDRYPRLKIRFISNPVGAIPAALNRGIAAARGAVIVRLDAFAIPAKDYLSQCLRTLQASAAHVVGGRLIIEPGAPGPTAKSIARALGHPAGAGDALHRIQREYPAQDVDNVPYCCFRKSLWEKLDGFNEELLSNEDYEFNWRVRKAGGRVHYSPKIRSTYFARASLGELAQQYFRYGWWKSRMLRMHPRSLYWRQALPAMLPVLVVLPVLALPYAAILTWAALALRDVRVPWALLTQHISWAAGLWASLLSDSRWPRWQPRLQTGRLAALLLPNASD